MRAEQLLAGGPVGSREVEWRLGKQVHLQAEQRGLSGRTTEALGTVECPGLRTLSCLVVIDITLILRILLRVVILVIRGGAVVCRRRLELLKDVVDLARKRVV